VAGPESRGALRGVSCQRLDVDTQVGHELPDDGDRFWSATPGIYEDLGVRARRQDECFTACLPYGGYGGGVVGVAGVERRDDDAGVEDDYRHSRRSFCSVPFGKTPVSRPA